MKKEETTYEARLMSPKTIEGLTEDCLRTQAACGNSDIEGVNILRVTVEYEYSTTRDLYRQTGVAAVMQDSEPEEQPKPQAEETLPEPKLVDRKKRGRDSANEPPDVFGEIDNADDGLEYHEADATGVPGAPDNSVARVSPHGETLEEEPEFNETDILADSTEPPGWDDQR